MSRIDQSRATEHSIVDFQPDARVRQKLFEANILEKKLREDRGAQDEEVKKRDDESMDEDGSDDEDEEEDDDDDEDEESDDEDSVIQFRQIVKKHLSKGDVDDINEY